MKKTKHGSEKVDCLKKIWRPIGKRYEDYFSDLLGLLSGGKENEANLFKLIFNQQETIERCDYFWLDVIRLLVQNAIIFTPIVTVLSLYFSIFSCFGWIVAVIAPSLLMALIQRIFFGWKMRLAFAETEILSLAEMSKTQFAGIKSWRGKNLHIYMNAIFRAYGEKYSEKKASNKNLMDSFIKVQNAKFFLESKKSKVIEESDSRFRGWLIPLGSFYYQHATYQSDSKFSTANKLKFFGREKLRHRFLSILKHNDSSSGSYLVTGYRGVGKTSFVKKVIDEYRLGVRDNYVSSSQANNWWLSAIKSFFQRLWVRGSGSFGLWWHRGRFLHCIAGQNTRLYSDYLRTTILLWKEYLPRLGAIALFGVWLYGLFNWSPPYFSSEAKTNTLEHFVLLIIPLLLIFTWFFSGLAKPLQVIVNLFNFRWWKNMLFRPILTIHLNLGTQSLDPKNVLFDLATLLRKEFSGKIGYFKLAPIFNIVVLPLVAILLVVWLMPQTRVFERQVQAYFLPELSETKSVEKPPLVLDNTAFVKSKERRPALITELDKARYYCLLADNAFEAGKSFFYCQLDEALRYLFRRQDEIAEANKKLIKANQNVKPEVVEVESVFYPLGWGQYAIHEFLQLVKKVTNEPVFGAEYAPRPIQFFLFLVAWVVLYLGVRGIGWVGGRRVFRALDTIYAQIVATETNEYNVGSKWFGLKKQKVVKPLDARQAEHLILTALEQNQRTPFFFPKLDVIFIFDELDKISAPVENAESFERGTHDSTPEEDVRRRKYDVEMLLGQLKNLITTAPCRFIFIGGRDMQDAYLADQGSPHHLYSSIFDETFYVPTFLTDSSDKRDIDVSSMVEQFVCRRLMSTYTARYVAMKLRGGEEHRESQPENYQPWNLRVYSAYLREVTQGYLPESERIHVITLLNHFIYFLTYRSRGNPNKLNLAFERFVAPISKSSHSDNSGNYRRVAPVFPRTRFALRFFRDDVYQIDMVANIYLLLLGDTSDLIRQYGDKLALSTFSVFDYLLKFHSTAFGPRELEYMPDILDIMRAPSLPKIVEVILKRLENVYLRKVENGLFEYRYITAWHREIEYLSQRSEQSLAAFNFTLDESIEIKNRYRNMLREQNILHKQESGISDDLQKTQVVHSTPAIYSTLGDLYMLDRDYDLALASYRNALVHLEAGVNQLLPTETESVEKSSFPCLSPRMITKRSKLPLTSSVRNLLIYMRVQLKTGLIAEMRGQYDNAGAIYAQTYRAIIEVARNVELGTAAIASDAEVMELLYQPRICMAFLHAKRDHSYKNFQKLAISSIEQYQSMWSKNAERTKPTDYVEHKLIARFYLRTAEAFCLRSQYGVALSGDEKSKGVYFRAIEKAQEVFKTSGRYPYKELGNILVGLGNALAAESLNGIYRGYVNKSFHSNAWVFSHFTLSIEVNDFSSSLDKILQGLCSLEAWKYMKFQHGLVLAIDSFVLAYHAYRKAGEPLPAWLALWRIEYFAVYAMTYKTVFDKQDFDGDLGSFIKNLDLEKVSRKLKSLGYRMLDSTHKVQQNRLRKIWEASIGGESVNLETNLDKWQSPMWVQNSSICHAFWGFYKTKKLEKIDENFATINQIGSFPTLNASNGAVFQSTSISNLSAAKFR